jgi:hypothetical protein
LEYLGSLHTVKIVAALERFFSRRGVPNSITADNTSSIVTTAGLTGKTKEIKKKKGINEDDFKGNQISWRFVPAGSPHRNGLAEAGIGAVKQILKNKMGKQVLTINKFNTVLCKVEGILNSRPIVGSDISEGKIITPFKLLIGKEGLRAPMIDCKPYSDTSNMRTKLVSRVCGRFEREWREAYLQSMAARNK